MLGKRIKKMMDVRDINLAELANKTKLSKGGLSMIINGKKNSVTTDSLNRIAKALNIHPSYFLEDDVVGPDELLKHIDDPEDRKFVLSDEGAMWVKVTREAAKSGLSPDKIRELIRLLKNN